MKKSFLFALLLTGALFTGCNNDDESIELVGYDDAYKISYYDSDPGIKTKQGFWVEGKFQKLTPQKNSPFNLFVMWNDPKGKEALDYLVEKNDAVILQCNKHNDYYELVTQKYIECPYFYVSSTYQTETDYKTYLLPSIEVVFKEGYDYVTHPFQSEYKNELVYEDAKGYHAKFYYRFLHHTSQELVNFVETINKREDIEYASPIFFSGKLILPE